MEIMNEEYSEMIENSKELELTETEEIHLIETNEDRIEYDEVLQLTEYSDGSLSTNTNNYGVVAEYQDIDIETVSKDKTLLAKNFVDKISKFIKSFNDIDLNDDLQNYLDNVATFQLDHLKDLLELVDINKQMLNNIVRRVNACQAEDYAIINTYNTLTNQHIKLLKELSNHARSIPTIIKKMRADVVCNQELDSPSSEELITENYGLSQFNSQKQLLKSLIEEEENNQNN